MKINVLFKTPGALDQAVEDYVEELLVSMMKKRSLDPDDAEELRVEAVEKIHGLKKWVRRGEYVTIEFDLTAGTATVKEA